MKTIADREIEVSVARMLLIGVTISAALVCCGGGLYLCSQSMTVPDYTHFRGQNAEWHGLAAVIHGAIRMNAASVIELGLLLLIATPVARVVLCVVGFLRQRDWLYVAVSTLVLAILFYSLVAGDR